MKYDVVIVGGGPAGSSAARVLAENGVKVVIIDKKTFPKDKPCGGGLPLHVLKRFPYTRNLIENMFFGGVIWSPSLKYKLERISDEPVGAMCLRRKLDHGLLKLAIEKGAEVIEGNAVKDIAVKNAYAKVGLKDETKLEGKIIIGADGVNSMIAKRTGLNQGWNAEEIALCIEIEPKIGEDLVTTYLTEKRILHCHPLYDNIPGYGWLFAKKEHINIGIGTFLDVAKKKPLAVIFSNYVNFLKRKGLIPDFVEVKDKKAHLIPLKGYIKKTYMSRVMLCGDAAGFVSPISGEGIYYAMASGEIAGSVAVNAIEQNDASERFLSAYQKLWIEDFGRDLKAYIWFQNELIKRTEKMVKFASKDERFGDMLFNLFMANLPAHKYKWKTMKNYAADWIKDKFGLL